MNTLSSSIPNNESNDNRVAIVIGASGGIGFSVVSTLLEKGWKVIAAARHREKLESTLAALEDPLDQLKICSLDASDSNAVTSFIESTVTEYGRIDGLVNCAGSILLKPAHLISDLEFEETLSLNLKTAFYLLRSSVRPMMKQPSGGSIVFCSSVAAQRGLMNHEAIAAAKAGIEGMALAAASTYAPYHIRVNCVAPGLVHTGMTQKLTENEAVLKKSASMHPLGRIGEPAEVASAITWFLDPLQSWITGQVLGIDGGLGNIQAR
ncbi:MAG: SDR family NAD(P)-dependent oxidoreductase [Verrucomicrobiae bacterium]|nr:SDR family NAD(P)-dependent oxidoreductase [Verrucomicrobiae bacterium]